MGDDLLALKADGDQASHAAGDVFGQLIIGRGAHGVVGLQVLVDPALDARVVGTGVVDVGVGVFLFVPGLQELGQVKVAAQLHLAVVHVHGEGLAAHLHLAGLQGFFVVLPGQLVHRDLQADGGHVLLEAVGHAGLGRAVGADDEVEVDLLRGAGHEFQHAVVVIVLHARALQDALAGVQVKFQDAGQARGIVLAAGHHGDGRGDAVAVQQLHQIGPVEGVLHGHAEITVAAQHALLVEGHVVHVGGGVGVDLVGAGVAQAGIAGGVVHDHVNVGVLVGGDGAGRVGVLLDVDHIHRQLIPPGVILVGVELRVLLVVAVGSAADGAHAVLGVPGAALDDRHVQELDKLGIADAQGHLEFILAGGRGALIAGETAPEAVSVDAHAQGIAEVRGGDRLAGGEGVGRLRVQREGPEGALLVAFPAGDHIGDDLEVVVHLHHVLIDQIADELVGPVGGDHGVKAVTGIGVEGKDLVQAHRFFHVPARGRLLQHILRALLPRAAAAHAQQHAQRQQQDKDSFFSLHVSLPHSTIAAAWPPRWPWV